MTSQKHLSGLDDLERSSPNALPMDSIGFLHRAVGLGRSSTENADSPMSCREKRDKMEDLRSKMSLAVYRVFRQCFAFFVPRLIS